MLTLRLSHVQFGYYHVDWPIGRKAPVIMASFPGTVISQVRIHRQIDALTAGCDSVRPVMSG